MIFMEQPIPSNEELAAALLWALGENVPHDRALEAEANRQKAEKASREELLQKVILMCSNPITPMQLYLTAKAYSLLGSGFYSQTIQFMREYLKSGGWDKLSGRSVMENGILINHLCMLRAADLTVLARAQENSGKLEDALESFSEAYHFEPYRAMHAVKVADLLVKLHGREEALLFLRHQKQSRYYSPIKYTDTLGEVRRNDEFRRLIDAHILKIENLG
jgi:tetratricopeptide (TPR) repeat protein